jgi:hypothetical protein
MDMEEAKLLAQTRLHCLVLEADKDAEQYKAKKYRDLLAELVGEAASDADADAPHPGHPQASSFPSMPGDTAARPVFPAVSPTYTVYHIQSICSGDVRHSVDLDLHQLATYFARGRVVVANQQAQLVCQLFYPNQLTYMAHIPRTQSLVCQPRHTSKTRSQALQEAVIQHHSPVAETTI